MRTHLSLPHEYDVALPDGHDGELRTPAPLVERFLTEFTEPGDRVFDPFAGYGTTLAVAERLGREPVGIEYEPDRVAFVEDRLDDPDAIRQGDVLDLDADDLPACECVFTSPPFMEREMAQNPFENYAGESSYADYLDDVEAAFARVKPLVAPDGTVVIDVCNMKFEGRVTRLAWDVAARVAAAFEFDGEVVVTWEEPEDDDAVAPSEDREGAYGYGYDHSYCLVFSKPA